MTHDNFYTACAAEDLSLYVGRPAPDQAWSYDNAGNVVDVPVALFRLREGIETNPARERILHELNIAVTACAEIVSGLRTHFIDSVGMCDDGEDSRVMITKDNVDEAASALLRRVAHLVEPVTAS